MLKLRCVVVLLVLVFPAFAQKLSGRLGNPARPFTITAETPDEGSFELQRSLGSLTNWVAFTNYNTLPSTNTFGDARTNKLSLYRLVRLEVPPAITSQPTGATNYVGQEIQLTASASGSWPIRYQWLKDSQPITGATSNKLVLTGQLSQAGNYNLVVSNSWSIALSSAATVKIINPVATNISNRKIRFVVKGGQGGVVTSGSFDTTFSSLGNYTAISSNSFLNDSGFWQYAFGNTQPIGRIFLNSSFIYPDGTVNDLTFTNETGGTYLIQVPNSSARQFGDFTFIP